MSVIQLERRHQLGAGRARELAGRIAADLERRYGMRHEWADSVLHFRRSGVQGELTVTDERLRLRLELGLMMRPLRDRIESAVARRLDELLAGEPGGGVSRNDA